MVGMSSLIYLMNTTPTTDAISTYIW